MVKLREKKGQIMRFLSFGFVVPIFAIMLIVACNSDNPEDNVIEDTWSPTPYSIPEEKNFPKNLNIPDDNPMTLEGVELGRYLFL